MNKLILSLIAVSQMVALQFVSMTAHADDCGPVINDAMSWLSTPDAGYQRYVGFNITTSKAPAKFISAAEGGFQFVKGSGRLAPMSYLKGENVKVTFSDRTWCPEMAPGLLCTGYQAFNYKAADTQQVLLYPNSTAKIVLTTWGNATYNIPLTCSNGFLFGTLVEPNGNSMVVLSLNKGRIQLPR